MLHATLAATVLVLADLKTIMGSLLEEPQYWIWERHWRRQLKELLNIYQQGQTQAFLTLEHLCGEGDFREPQDQADVILAEVLEDHKEAAKKALLNLTTPGVPPDDFASIQQELGENFLDFVKRLKAAVGRQGGVRRPSEIS